VVKPPAHVQLVSLGVRAPKSASCGTVSDTARKLEPVGSAPELCACQRGMPARLYARGTHSQLPQPDMMRRGEGWRESGRGARGMRRRRVEVGAEGVRSRQRSGASSSRTLTHRICHSAGGWRLCHAVPRNVAFRGDVRTRHISPPSLPRADSPACTLSSSATSPIVHAASLVLPFAHRIKAALFCAALCNSETRVWPADDG
jgi:hypothetical protein